MFGFNKKANTIGVKGQPVHVNSSNNSNRTIRRHLLRIVNCRLALKKERKYIKDERKNALLEEINLRETHLKLLGIITPKEINVLIKISKRYVR